jgi:hypothetical protein
MQLEIDRAVQSLATGKIAFESPLKMKLNETKVVEVRIAEKLNQDLTGGLATSGHVQVEDIKVGPLMAATLKGSAFQITSITKEEQVIASDSPTPWSWSIRPLDWGKQTLYLDVCVRLQLRNQREERRCSPVYQRDVVVEVAPIYAATHFINNNATWTLGTVGSGASVLFGALIAWMKKRGRKHKETVLQP